MAGFQVTLIGWIWVIPERYESELLKTRRRVSDLEQSGIRSRQLRWKRVLQVKRVLLLLIAAVFLLIAFRLYQSWSENRSNVTPDAQREIEKAKRR